MVPGLGFQKVPQEAEFRRAFADPKSRAGDRTGAEWLTPGVLKWRGSRNEVSSQ